MNDLHGVVGAVRHVGSEIRDLTVPQPLTTKLPPNGAEAILVSDDAGNVVPIPTEAIVGATADQIDVQTPRGQMPIPKDRILSTDGNLASSSATRAAGYGGVEGGFAAGLSASTLMSPAWMPALAGGMLGGYAGVKEGESSHSMTRAMATGAAVGAGTGMAVAAGLVTLGAAMGAVIPPLAVVLPLAAVGLMLAPTSGKLSAAVSHNPVLRTLGKAASHVGSAVGKVDRKLHGTLGILAGVGVAAGAVAAFPVAAPVLALVGLSGAAAGAMGTLAGNRLSDVRDRQRGGFLVGTLASSMLPVGPISLFAGVGSAAATGKASAPKQAIKAFGTSFVLGAAGGALAGPVAALATGLAAGTAAVVGTAVGPRLMQALRNVGSIQVPHVMDRFLGARVEHSGARGHELTAAAGGALMGGLAGLIATPIYGPLAMVVPAAAGAAYFAYRAHQAMKAPPAQPAPPASDAAPPEPTAPTPSESASSLPPAPPDKTPAQPATSPAQPATPPAAAPPPSAVSR